MRGRKGFTLIELLVVIIIVGILAAISIPMMTANVQRARRSEAQAALGSLRTAQRVYRSEHTTYASSTSGLMLSTADLDGVYYNGDVTITAGSATFSATIKSKSGQPADTVTISEAGSFGYIP